MIAMKVVAGLQCPFPSRHVGEGPTWSDRAPEEAGMRAR